MSRLTQSPYLPISASACLRVTGFTVSASVVPLQLKAVRWNETQEGSVDHPISHIIVETPPSVDPLFHLLREMGVAEDDHLKPVQKLLIGKHLESRRGNGLDIVVILFVAHVA